jgi:beta-glucosidase-like glycosyl hydrolase
VDELKKEGVISTLKHFPGHGSSLADFTVSYTLGYYGSQAVSELFASLISINNIDYKNNKIFKNVA